MPDEHAVRTVVRLTREAERGTLAALPHQDLYEAYGCCQMLLTPTELATAVARYCTRVGPHECAKLAGLLQGAFRRVGDPQVRPWLRLDPAQASPAQVAQMHRLAQERLAPVLARIYAPGGASAGPGAREALAGIVTEAVRMLSSA
jgi:hypothetical protein